jgi:murein DD-endopeptidase MepM/ murein hydrolase activator NlpD
MLRTSGTYQHIARLIDRLPPGARSLNLLPSVLPIDVPIRAFQVSSFFGMRRHPIHDRTLFHGGVDVRAVEGITVKATAAGLIQRVGFHPALGLHVVIRHAFGFETTYGHLSSHCVQPGDTVFRNQEIGRVGRTGRVTGPHLHYVIKKNGSAIDPYFFCFLLRRRLWLYSISPLCDGVSGVSRR